MCGCEWEGQAVGEEDGTSEIVNSVPDQHLSEQRKEKGKGNQTPQSFLRYVCY